ncbi:MAG: efflux RND transporter periplasmic adaptor subunit [Acidobacteriota bacterium]
MRLTVRLGVTCALALGVGLSAAGCGTSSAPPPSGAAPPPTVNLSPQNVVTVTVGTLSSGPVVSGQLTPARQASVRAEVGGSLVSLTVDRGDAVASGAQVARVSSRDLEATRASAETAVKSAETALSVAKSEAQRTDALVKGGALAARDLEQANNAVSMAQAQSAAALARLRSVEQQLADTIIKAPFAGVVSERPASIGDVVAPGTPILTIIDPSSMRLEAQVPSDQISQVRRGATVKFTIRGVPGEVTGTVDRINPSADPVTRQVSIFVSLRNTGGKLISGLFAEGRVESATHQGLVAPLAALDETGPRPVVTRIRDGKAEKVEVTVGLRQANPEQAELTSGVAANDMLIVGSAKNVAAGTAIAVVK